MPRIKTFVWKLTHEKLVTGAYLHQLNIGPHTICPFCSLSDETATHLIWDCSKISSQWRMLFALLELNPDVFNSLHNGAWLTVSFKSRADDV